MSAGRVKVAVFGVPSAAGSVGPGTELAPFALRQAGLLGALGRQGAEVVNLSDLSLFPYADEPPRDGVRNAAAAACAASATADEMERALGEGFVIALGGDCSLVAGAVAGARRALSAPVGLVFLDANADLNTPDTSPSGILAGMALSLALGRGPLDFARLAEARLDPDHVSLVGFRDLDPGERHRLGDLGLALPVKAANFLGMRATAALALDGVNNGDGPIVVHMDVDLVDGELMPAKTMVTPGQGFSWREAGDLLAALLSSPRVVALLLTEFNPARDEDGRYAALLVELLARGLGARIARARRTS